MKFRKYAVARELEKPGARNAVRGIHTPRDPPRARKKNAKVKPCVSCFWVPRHSGRVLEPGLKSMFENAGLHDSTVDTGSHTKNDDSDALHFMLSGDSASRQSTRTRWVRKTTPQKTRDRSMSRDSPGFSKFRDKC